MKLIKSCLTVILFTITKPLVGGQAVFEGVMMRSPKSFAVAVRLSTNSIIIRERAWLSFSERLRFLRFPLFRGVTMLVESLYNGISALQFSVEQAIPKEEKKSEKIIKSGSNIALVTAMILSLFMGTVFFKGIPHLLTFMFGELLGVNGNSALPISSIWFHVIDGTIKILLFVGYVLLISKLNDVKRLFMYHGAEHKAVHAFEKNFELNVKKTQIQSIFHPRCGTSLIVLVMVVSIVCFSLFLPFLPVVTDNRILQSLFALFVKILLMLPIASIAYEFQKLAVKYPDKPWVKFFIAPGMFMQKLTTKEPEDDQVEVALTALKKALWREKHSVDIGDDIKRCQSQTEGENNEIIEIFCNFSQVCQRIV